MKRNSAFSLTAVLISFPIHFPYQLLTFISTSLILCLCAYGHIFSNNYKKVKFWYFAGKSFGCHIKLSNRQLCCFWESLCYKQGITPRTFSSLHTSQWIIFMFCHIQYLKDLTSLQNVRCQLYQSIYQTMQFSNSNSIIQNVLLGEKKHMLKIEVKRIFFHLFHSVIFLKIFHSGSELTFKRILIINNIYTISWTLRLFHKNVHKLSCSIN